MTDEIPENAKCKNCGRSEKDKPKMKGYRTCVLRNTAVPKDSLCGEWTAQEKKEKDKS